MQKNISQLVWSFLPKNYALHLGFDDEKFKSQGVKIFENEKDIIEKVI